jgi:hypothetical protein
MTADLHDAAAAFAYWDSVLPPGAAIIPLRAREKRPLQAGWTETLPAQRRDPAFREVFRGEVGVGLLGGKASGGLCFVDFDQEEWAGKAESLWPALGAAPRFVGHRGARWLVRVQGDTAGFAIKGPDGARMGEFLGDRQQAVLAGIHPRSGLPYRCVWRSPIPLFNPAALPLVLHHDHRGQEGG